MKRILIATCLIYLSGLNTHAQEMKIEKDEKQNELQFKVKGTQNPDIYIDGKKYDYEILELLDPAKIESVNVVKGEQAIKKYNSKNGVILVKTKKGDMEHSSLDETAIKIRAKDNDNSPIILIDGKVSNKEFLEKISPDSIKSIEVVKGEKALKDYKAANGIIIVKTKN